MSTPNLNVLLNASIATYDNLAPNTPLLSNVNPGSLPFGAAASFRDDYLLALTGSTSIPLPAATSYVVWVRNRDAANTVGVSVTFLVVGVQQVFIGPGDVFLYFNASKTSGFTALALTALVGNAVCEVYVAG